jgi:hypothetical protein
MHQRRSGGGSGARWRGAARIRAWSSLDPAGVSEVAALLHRRRAGDATLLLHLSSASSPARPPSSLPPTSFLRPAAWIRRAPNPTGGWRIWRPAPPADGGPSPAADLVEGGPDERRCAWADAATVDGLGGPIHGFFFFYLINRGRDFNHLGKDLFTVTL